MRPPVKAVLFDLDGVLLDTEPLYTQATSTVVSRYGRTYEMALKRRIMGGSAQSGAALIVEELGLPISPQAYLDERRVELDRLFLNTLPICGAPELVRFFFERGLPLALATSSERELFEFKSRPHAWFAMFSSVVCGDDSRLTALKPAPDIFHLAASELGVLASNCIIFEDSPAGVTAAKRSGGFVVARRDSMLSREDLADADVIVESYAELNLEQLLSSET